MRRRINAENFQSAENGTSKADSNPTTVIYPGVLDLYSERGQKYYRSASQKVILGGIRNGTMGLSRTQFDLKPLQKSAWVSKAWD